MLGPVRRSRRCRACAARSGQASRPSRLAQVAEDRLPRLCQRFLAGLTVRREVPERGDVAHQDLVARVPFDLHQETSRSHADMVAPQSGHSDSEFPVSRGLLPAAGHGGNRAGWAGSTGPRNPALAERCPQTAGRGRFARPLVNVTPPQDRFRAYPAGLVFERSLADVSPTPGLRT